ncbi:MAG: ankyrin repeat domain-containing protein [Proteobacteria bacterium]|nr:ankyrin repeat domain-containing protein [Pseudomonadota bacterium]
MKYLVLWIAFSAQVCLARNGDVFEATDKGKVSEVRGAITRADVNSVNEHGETALIRGISKGYLEISDLLLKNGAQINHRDKAGNTAILYAVSNNNLEAVQLLLKFKPDLSLKYGPEEENIFFEVARMGDLRILKALTKSLKKDRSLLQTKNKSGKSVADVALDSGHRQFAKELGKILKAD